MTSYTFTLDIAEEKEKRIFDALRDEASRSLPLNSNGTKANPNKREAWEWYSQWCKDNLKQLAKSYNRAKAREAVEAAAAAAEADTEFE